MRGPRLIGRLRNRWYPSLRTAVSGPAVLLARGRSGGAGRSRVRVAVPAPVPGLLVRLLPGAGVLLGARILASGAFGWVLCLAAAVLVTGWPAAPVAAAFSLVVGLAVAVEGDLLAGAAGPTGTAGVLRLAGAVLVVHLVIATAALASHVGWRARVEGRVLARTAVGVLTGQAVAQSLVLLALLARGGAAGGGEAWRAAAVVAAAVLAVLVLPRRRAGRDHPDSTAPER